VLLPGLLQRYYHTKLQQMCDVIQQLQEQEDSGEQQQQVAHSACGKALRPVACKQD
jgi:hypothetical protein